MWPFKRKQTIDINAESYLRWLRAEKPDFEVFFRLSELEQEGLAGLGDAWRAEMVEQALGADLSDATPPQEPAAEEESHVMKIVGDVARGIVAKQGGKPPVSNSGFGDRTRAYAKKRQDAHDAAGTQMFGRPPDEPSGKTG